MRLPALSLLPVMVLAMTAAADAGQASSEYTDLDTQKHCATYELYEEGAGAALACAGWRGWPVLISAGDLRESVFYGFPPDGETAWESFSAFNHVGPKVEWRIWTDGDVSYPYATIHRWFVSDDPEDPEKQVEVLVVSKVGQPGERDGCAVGLVLASGRDGANKMARTIADEQARDFACGADERVIVGEPIPEFSRSE